MNLLIRPFEDSDYEAMVEIHNLNNPDNPPQTAQDRRREDRIRNPELVYRRFAVVINGQLVGSGNYNHLEYAFHPERYGIGLSVHPEFHQRGIGTRLVDHMLQELAQRNPLSVRTMYREDRIGAVRLAEKFGFVEDNRSFDSRLNPQTFDPTPYTAKQLVPGYTIHSLAELQTDPDHQHKLYELDRDASADSPMPPGEVITYPSFERYAQDMFEDVHFYPQGIFVAIHQASGEWAGIHTLWKTNQPDKLSVGFTGVRREHRGKGLALALKLRGLVLARSSGIVEMRTGNDSRNRPMLSINERLGFVKDPTWVSAVKIFRG